MDSFSDLKHLSRSPLPLYRIPPSLIVQIITKQSAATLYNMAFANFNSSILVEKFLSQDPHVAVLREILKHDKTKLLEPKEIIEFFPVSYYSSSKRGRSLYNWIALLGHRIQWSLVTNRLESDIPLRDELFPKIKLLLPLCYSTLSNLWKEQRLLGPQQISLQSIPTELWKSILSKASAVSATRLARARSSVATILDKYIQSKESIKIMEKYSDNIIKKRGTGEWARTDSSLWHIDNLNRSFYRHTLLEMSIGHSHGIGREPQLTENEKAIMSAMKADKTSRDKKNMDEAEKKFRQLGSCGKQKILYKVDSGVIPE